jgi:hypothetical protein
MIGVTGQLRDRSAWVYLLIFLALVAVAMIIQGATVHKIGIGPLSVEFDRSGSGRSDDGDTGPHISFPTDILRGILGGSQDFSKAKSITGSWRQRQGGLTVEVTQVDNQDGFVRLHVKVINDDAESLTLPLYGGQFSAVDNVNKTHDAGFSEWHETVPAHALTTNTVDLGDKVDASATRLDIAFPTIIGSVNFAYDSGISIRHIPIPH